MSEKISLSWKLAKIGEELGKIAKTGKTADYGEQYNYIEYGVVSGKIRTLFAKHGVIIVPSVQSYEVSNVESKKGAHGYHYILSMKFTVINGDDPNDKIEAEWLGESTDYGDKGVNKAETAGVKYFLMRLLNISERGDEDPDSTIPAPRSQSSGKLTGNMGPSPKQKAWLLKYYTEKSAMGEDEAKAEVAKFKTAKEASAEISKLIEEDKNNGGN